MFGVGVFKTDTLMDISYKIGTTESVMTSFYRNTNTPHEIHLKPVCPLASRTCGLVSIFHLQ
jgi:hypothetical protein